MAEGLEGGKVAGAQGKEGNFVEACFAQTVIQQAGDSGQGAFAHGPVHHARVAEATAARAAARDFQGKTVVHRAHGNHLPGGVDRRIQIRHDAARRAGIVGQQRDRRAALPGGKKRGHIHAGNQPGLAQQLITAPALIQSAFQQAQHIGQALLSVAQNHQIHEGRQGFGAQQRAPAGNDQRADRQILAAPGRAQGNAGQIQHIEHIGVTKLMGDGKGHAMQAGQRRV